MPEKTPKTRELIKRLPKEVVVDVVPEEGNDSTFYAASSKSLQDWIDNRDSIADVLYVGIYKLVGVGHINVVPTLVREKTKKSSV